MNEFAEALASIEAAVGRTEVGESVVDEILIGRSDRTVTGVTYLGLATGVLVMDRNPALLASELRWIVDALPAAKDAEEFASQLARQFPVAIDGHTTLEVFKFAQGFRDDDERFDKQFDVICDGCSSTIGGHQMEDLLECESFECNVCESTWLCLMKQETPSDMSDEVSGRIFGALMWLGFAHNEWVKNQPALSVSGD